MGRWLTRLLILGILAALAAFVLSRLMNPEDDFDEFDDIEAGFEFEETPVEIDVPVQESAGSAGGTGMAMGTQGNGAGDTADTTGSADGSMQGEQNGQSAGQEDDLTAINGIGAAYAGRLHALGITTFAQLASSDPDQLTELLGPVGGRQAVGEWISQAEQLTSQSGAGGDSQPSQ
jgi:predicted flap endonuclease-1-like 5' DNA nuclease